MLAAAILPAVEPLEWTVASARDDALESIGIVAISRRCMAREFREMCPSNIPRRPAQELGGLNRRRIFQIAGRHRRLEVDEVMLATDANDVAAVRIGMQEPRFPPGDGPRLAATVVGEDAGEQLPFLVDSNGVVLQPILQRGTIQELDDQMLCATKFRNLQYGDGRHFESCVRPHPKGKLFTRESFAGKISGVALDEIGPPGLVKDAGAVGGNAGGLKRLQFHRARRQTGLRT